MQQPAKVPENTRARMTDLTSVTRHLTCLNRPPRQRCAKKTSRGGKALLSTGLCASWQQSVKDSDSRLLKNIYRQPQRMGAAFEVLGRSGGLLHQRSVLLGHGVQLGDGLVHLCDANRLLLGGCS